MRGKEGGTSAKDQKGSYKLGKMILRSDTDLDRALNLHSKPQLSLCVQYSARPCLQEEEILVKLKRIEEEVLVKLRKIEFEGEGDLQREVE